MSRLTFSLKVRELCEERKPTTLLSYGVPFPPPLNSFESERRVTIRQRRFCPRNLRLVGRALLRPPVLGNPFCKTPITAAGVLNGRVAGGAFNWTATDPL